jgi:hypothetical protein
VDICSNAAGQYILLLYWSLQEQERIHISLSGAPEASHDLSSFWMGVNKNSFYPFRLGNFWKSVKRTKNGPVTLILDGHVTHTKNIALSERPPETRLHIFCVLSTATHITQVAAHGCFIHVTLMIQAESKESCNDLSSL